MIHKNRLAISWKSAQSTHDSWEIESRSFGIDSAQIWRDSLILQWWARQDSNLQPDRYERPALTIELQAPPRDGRIGSGRQRCAVRLQGWRRGCNPQAFSSEAAAGPRRGKRVKQRALIEAERRGCVESVAHRPVAEFGIIVFCHCLARRVKWPPRSSSRCLSFRFPNPL